LYEAVLEEVRTSRVMIKAAQQDVRESILSLRTTLSEDLPLLTALEQYVLEFGAQTGIEARFEKANVLSVQLPPLAEMETIRIVQEALTNVRKHAQAAAVSVAVNASERYLSITICDNGIGLNLHQTERSHFGLATMRERAQKIGGTLTITSAPGAGTVIHVRIPLLEPLLEHV
ncbi:MAG: ATP-binding protein, partial [Aggregatilineales bacterium]